MKKAQKLRIIERGWETFTGNYGGVEFDAGVSVEPVAPSIALTLGSYIRIDAIDDGEQVSESKKYQSSKKDKAEVKKALTEETPVTPSKPAADVTNKMTKADLEALADSEGITGLRKIADNYGVKGRGIVELINVILQAQESK